MEPTRRRRSFSSKLIGGLAQRLDRRYGWHRLPKPIAILTLIGLRDRLREENLYDTAAEASSAEPLPADSRWRTARTIDGTYND
jgi:hypothetical protein